VRGSSPRMTAVILSKALGSVDIYRIHKMIAARVTTAR